MRRQACMSRYRTQEVAGSSPASSIEEAPANRAISDLDREGSRGLIYLLAAHALASPDIRARA